MIQQEKFKRFEFKYVLPERQREIFEEYVKKFMDVDSHIRKFSNAQYFVRSLYFDSPENAAFYEKIDGIKKRKKYRLRVYETELSETTNLFLEEKGRYNQRVFKHRVAVDTDIYRDVIRTGNYARLGDSLADTEVGRRFMDSYLRKRLSPKVLVDYYRRPYVSNYDVYFRVTLDQQLSACSTRELFEKNIPDMRLCLPGYTIVEVKFNRRIPAWFHRVLKLMELERVSISKFVVGMTTCGIAKNLS
jgi:hypothetical protein